MRIDPKSLPRLNQDRFVELNPAIDTDGGPKKDIPRLARPLIERMDADPLTFSLTRKVESVDQPTFTEPEREAGIFVDIQHALKFPWIPGLLGITN